MAASKSRRERLLEAASKSRRERRKRQFVLEDWYDLRPTFHLFEETDTDRPPGAIALITGRAAKTGVINKNKRYYSREVFEKTIGKAQTAIAEGSMVGELDHPDWDASLKTTTIKFTRLFLEEDHNDPERPFVAFEGIVLDNEHGRQLLSLLEAGVKIGMSTRGSGKRHVGNIAGEEDVTIIEEFDLDGIDAVGNPSNQFAGIAHHEGEGDDDDPSSEGDEMELTLETLREKHPKLVEAIQQMTVKSLLDAHEKAMEELNAEQKTVMSELQDRLKVANDKIADLAIKIESTGKSNAEKVLAEKIEEATKDAKATAEKAVAEAKTLKEQLENATKSDRKAARALTITEAVKNDKAVEYATFFRNRLEAVPESEEMTADVIERCRADGESIWVSIGKPEGVGRLPKDGDRKSGQNNKGGKDGKGGDEETLEGVDQFAVLSGME